jgi:hypothetical protein
MTIGLRRFTRVQAAKTLMGLVPHLSVDNLVRATAFAERLTRVERDRATIRAIREHFERRNRPTAGRSSCPICS